MDMESITLLISNTLMCVFVGLQHLHVKRHPEVLPFISFVMLSILTLGHMMPLVLNFEALLLQNHGQQGVLPSNRGQPEANLVIMRVTTMVAFLLQSLLLRQAWSARLDGVGNERYLWSGEKASLISSLPFYAAGTLMVWLKNWSRNRFDLKSYADSFMDFFLLPQILLNLLRNSNEYALSCSFYMGITSVRLLQQAHNFYRAYNKVIAIHRAYSETDFDSMPWDIIISLWSLFFAGIVYLQQRFGGHCILTMKFRKLEVDLAAREE